MQRVIAFGLLWFVVFGTAYGQAEDPVGLPQVDVRVGDQVLVCWEYSGPTPPGVTTVRIDEHDYAQNTDLELHCREAAGGAE